MNTHAWTRLGWMLLGLVGCAAAQAQVAVGRTEGEASVTAAGSARYVIPLGLPPGTAGVAPSLALAYDSRAGNGLLGVGFRLSGLSVVHRCARTIAQDGAAGPVELGAADRYCLDGQRLRLTAGTYGQPGSQYQTEVETFARVTALGSAGAGPASFRVERRDGLVYEYGATEDSRIEATGSATPREWALSRIRDRNGNHVDLVYAEHGSTGGYRPLRVDYTGNLQTGDAPYYSVRFAYEGRPPSDVPVGYAAGGIVHDPFRLDRIDVVHPATGRTLRSYDVAYDVPGPTGRSRIGSVQDCAGASCFAPTRFTWTAVPAGWSVNMLVSIASTAFETALPGDFDGDGFEDLAWFDGVSRQWLVHRGGPSGFGPSAVATGVGAGSDASQAVTADLDGDGRRDILVPGTGNYWHRLWRTGGGAWSYNATGIANVSPPGGMTAADIDGDGRDDLVYVKTGGDRIFWRRNQTSGASSYAAEAVLWAPPPATRLKGAPFLATSQRFRSVVRQGDFNGDGRADLVVLTEVGTCGPDPYCGLFVDRWQVLVSNGAALAAQYLFEGGSEPLLADFNADSLTDVAFWGPGFDWRLLLAKGARGPALATFEDPLPTSAVAPAAAGRALLIDWDADGRSDVLQPASGGELQVCRSNGTSLDACVPAGINPGTAITSPMTLDANGDGYPDLAYAAGSVRLLLHHQLPPDRLVTATDAFGAQSTFEYTALSNPAVHAVGSGASYPLRDAARLGAVVSRATLAGARGPMAYTYFYEGARADALGRGFLGFARRTVSPTNGGLVRVEEYSQDPSAWERIGAPTRITLQQPSGSPVRRSTLSWSRLDYGTGFEARRHAYPARVNEERFELDGVRVSSTVTDTTLDTFGTPVQQHRTTTEHAKGSNPGAQHSETTTLYDVVNDTANWCLNRASWKTVTRQHTLPGGSPVTRGYGTGWDYPRCRAVQHVVEPSSESLSVTTDLAFDAYGNVHAASVTPGGAPYVTTTYHWTQQGRFLTSTMNPEGEVTLAQWDPALAVPTTRTDRNGLLSTTLYDDFGRPTRETRPDGTSTSLALVACASGGCATADARYALRSTEIGAGGEPLGSRERGFDAWGRESYSKQELPGGGHAYQVRRFDPRGLPQQDSLPAPCCAAPSRWVRYTHDLLGRRTAQERPASEGNPALVYTRWRHDGLSVTETDVLGRSTTRRHDAMGNVLQVVDPGLADSDYEYDAFGNLVRLRDFAGSETTMTYDLRGFRRSLDDPSTGRWTLDWHPTGELRSQVNPRGQETRYAYDRISRLISRTEPEGTTTWTWGRSTATRNVGAITGVTAPGYYETLEYDALGRPATSTATAGGVAFVTRQTYHAVTGLPDVLTYPSSTGSKPLRVRHHYDRGRLVRLSNADGGATFWQLNAVDSRGLVADESLGNGVRIASVRDAVTGDLLSRQAGPGGGSMHQNLAYSWDAAGNLLQREERNLGVVERFTYDSRDRLDLVTLNGATTLDVDYDEVGNVLRKSDVGNYAYHASRRQLVTSAGANTYAYDAGGAVVNASGTTIGWSSYDLPAQITHPGGNSATFSYGPDRARYRQLANAGGVLSETLYAAGGLFERRSSAGVTTFHHHIVADGRRVAVHTRRSGASPTTVYLLEDHQGSVAGFTTSSGVLKARASYRPFGARRGGDWSGTAPTSAEWSQINATTARGYTDHEHLDNLGLVHMNGRVYDPVLGRFLSPDPVMQAPFDTQGLNRYAYVRNNPLRYTDPSGHCFNTHPAADHLVGQCLEQIFVSSFGISSTRLTEIWNLVDYDSLLADLSRAGSVPGLLEPPAAIETESSAGQNPGSQEQPETAVTVEGRRALLAGLAVAVPTMAPPLNSWATSASARLLANLGAGASLAAALAIPTELSESSELTNRQGEPHYLYHFTNQVGRLGIDSSGFIAPGRSGRVYLSPLPYNTADSAQRALSLPRTPTGYYMIPRSNVPGALIWTPVAPNFGQPGGGLEASVGGVVSVAGSVWIDIGP